MGLTAGQQNASELARWQSDIASSFSKFAEPGLKQVVGDTLKDLGQPGQEPVSVQTAYDQYRSDTNAAFAAQATRDKATITQLAKQSGQQANVSAVGDTATQVLSDLESGRRDALRNLKENETDAAISQRNFDLSTLFGIGTGQFGVSQGYLNAALGAGSQATGGGWSGALSGAVSGAATGTSISAGWGTLIGAVAGAALGYFSGR